MKTKFLAATALAAALALPAMAAAQEGWYGRADVGYAPSGTLDIAAPVAGPTGEGALAADWAQGLGLGYAFGNGVRIEGALGHTYNNIDPSRRIGPSGSAHAWTAMINALYDLNSGGAVNPYIGAGVGIGRVDAYASCAPRASGAAPSPDCNSAATAGIFDDSDTGFAWNLFAGLGFKLTERLTGDLGYRYTNIPNLTFAGRVGTAARNYEADYDSHAVMLGLRYAFAAPAAPPPPPPPQAASRAVVARAMAPTMRRAGCDGVRCMAGLQ